MEFDKTLLIDYNHARKAMAKFFSFLLVDECKKKVGLWLSLDSSAVLGQQCARGDCYHGGFDGALGGEQDAAVDIGLPSQYGSAMVRTRCFKSPQRGEALWRVQDVAIVHSGKSRLPSSSNQP